MTTPPPIKEMLHTEYGFTATTIEPVTGGSYNESFLTADDSGRRYLLKRYSTLANFEMLNLENALKVQDFIAQSSLAPLIIKTLANNLIAQQADHRFVLMQYAEGAVYERKTDVGTSDWRRAATGLGEVHNLLSGYRDPLPGIKVDFDFAAYNLPDDIQHEIEAQITEAKALANYVDKLPSQPVHGDPSIDNWIFTNKGTVLIDWDTATTATKECDLLFFDSDKLGIFMNHYTQTNTEAIDFQALRYYLLVHQLQLYKLRLEQTALGQLPPELTNKYFLPLRMIDKKVDRFKKALHI